MNRDDILRNIPKPSNRDVIVYDISLKDLIDEDVIQSYNKLYPVFIEKRKKYMELKERLAEYKNTLSSIYLFKPNWTEADYLQSLQNDKRTYATLYKEIKKKETNIETLKRKVEGLDEKIKIQIAKEEKAVEDKKKTMGDEIERDKEKLFNYKAYLDGFKITLKNINEQIAENEEQFKLLSKMQEDAESGKCHCEFCGKAIDSTGENSIFFNKMIKNFEKNKQTLEKLLQRKTNISTNIEYYQKEINDLTAIVNNKIQFRKNVPYFYHKKTTEVLKLEALRNESLNEIEKLTKEVKSNPQVKSKQYEELKENIKKYELSLDNLNKIKLLKQQNAEDIDEFNEIKIEIVDMLDKMKKYTTFISYYFKIIEQKAADFCGKEFKFSFFKIDDYKFYPILVIYYNDIEYSELPKTEKDKADEILLKKFPINF